MRDKHLNYTELSDGKLKILPEDGWRMMCTLTKQYVSEAIVREREVKYFVSEEMEDYA